MITKLKQPLPLLLISLGVVVLIIVGTIAVAKAKQLQLADQARQTARQLIHDLNAGDMPAAYKHTSAKTKSNMTAAEFGTIFNDLHAAHPRFSKEALSVKDADATYTVAIDGLTNTRSGKTKATFTIGLTKSENHWQVSSIKVQ